jgi:hypothetical protein
MKRLPSKEDQLSMKKIDQSTSRVTTLSTFSLQHMTTSETVCNLLTYQ